MNIDKLEHNSSARINRSGRSFKSENEKIQGQEDYTSKSVRPTKKTVKELKAYQGKLKYLCMNFDPYASEIQHNREIENIIEELSLDEYIKDPFVFTNEVLKRLDSIEQQLKSIIN